MLPFRIKREKLIEQSEPFLEEDEVAAHVVRALEGPNRWFALAIAVVVVFNLSVAMRGGGGILLWPLMIVLFTSLYKRRVLLATDRNLVVLGGSRFSFRPRKLLERLPLETRIGPMKGLWMQARVNGRRLYIQPRSVQEATAADADLDE